MKETTTGSLLVNRYISNRRGSLNLADHKRITIFAAGAFLPHKRLNNAFMLHASTSPFYPLFAALDQCQNPTKGRVVAACGRGALRWALTRVKPFSPLQTASAFIPLVVDGKPWRTSDGDHCQQSSFLQFLSPEAKWRNFEGYADDQYFVDL